MARTAQQSAVKRRTASKEERQEQLIQATIRSVASRGLSDTTMATVASEAGLSQGIINLHFQSKDRLLVETLKYIADEYRQTWKKALNGAGKSAAERLEALVMVDFRLPVCDRNKLAVVRILGGEQVAAYLPPDLRRARPGLSQGNGAGVPGPDRHGRL